MNVAIIVACTPCFPAFFAKAKIYSSSVFSFLLSQRLSYISRPVLGKKGSHEANAALENKESLKRAPYLELQDAQGFGRLTVTESGNIDIKYESKDHFDVAPEFGIWRKVDVQVESHASV